MCGMCQAHLPTPGEGRGKGQAEGRGEGRGSRQPEKTCLFSGGRSPVRAFLLPSAHPDAPRAKRPLTQPGRVRRCPLEGASAPRLPDPPPVPQAGHLYQVGLLSRHPKDRALLGGSKGHQVCVFLDKARASVSLLIIHTRSTHSSWGSCQGDSTLGFLLFTVSEETERQGSTKTRDSLAGQVPLS